MCRPCQPVAAQLARHEPRCFTSNIGTMLSCSGGGASMNLRRAALRSLVTSENEAESSTYWFLVVV